MKHYAILGDLHGRILLGFWLVKRWQEEHREEIEDIFCVGDLGFFRGFEAMDKPSRRYAEKHPEELGFSKFFWTMAQGRKGRLRLARNPRTDKVLDGLRASLYFVAGNHEEHSYIRFLQENFATDASKPMPVDVDWAGLGEGLYRADEFSGYRRIYLLPQGPVVDLSDPLSRFSLTIRAVNGLENFTPRDAYRSPQPGTVDILLTHETLKGRLRGGDITGERDEYGSEKLAEFILRLAPRWHFFGHHHWYYPCTTIRAHDGSSIQSVGLNQLTFEDDTGKLSPGAFGILTAADDENADLTYESVDDEWYRAITYETSKGVL